MLLKIKKDLQEAYENAAFQVEGDLSLLALLVLFFEPHQKYTKVKKDFDFGENIETYQEIFEKINEMNVNEIKTFLYCYEAHVDGLMAWLREAIVDKYKQKKPKACIEVSKCPKGLKTQKSLF